ncbi:MAG: hypothetical protein WBM53_18150 [Maribacter sp.]
MATFLKHIILFIVVFLAFNVAQEEVVDHKVVVSHPAFEEGTSKDFVLKEIRRKNNPSEFYLEVESVICIDHLCKIVPVRLFWNAYGDYLKYELDNGIRLEKGEGEPFSEEDYQMLQKILLDKDSPYKDISYYEITHEKVVGEGQVDAVSGATETVLKNGETVIGAAWTCFTLWHWANGEITQEVRRVSGSFLSEHQLIANLLSSNQKLQKFALNELIRRRTYEQPVINSIVKIAPTASKEINKLAIEYIDKAPQELYLEITKQLYIKGNEINRILFLNSIASSKIIGGPDFYDAITTNITYLKSFQEIDLVLDILEYSKSSEPTFLDRVAQLLDNDNFIIARKAYWFLEGKKLSSVNDRKVKEFYIQNLDRLQ